MRKLLFIPSVGRGQQNHCLPRIIEGILLVDGLPIAATLLYLTENRYHSNVLVRWVSRVPATLTAAKQLLQDIDSSAFIASSLPGYKIAACGNSYAGIQQRWLVIESQARRESDLKDEQVLSDEDVLTEYKAQQSTERGFRFLKEPLFFTSSIFLNTLQRVTASSMVMGLCLLVYSPCQRSLRQALDKAKQTVDNQVGKSTALPTLRWMFQCFMSIHLLTVEGAKHITNLTTEWLWILQFRSAPCRKYYLHS